MDAYPLLPPSAPITAPQIIARILTLPRDFQIAAVLRHCIELGGTLIQPGQGTHLFEITLLGVHARGEDLAAAARNWLMVGRNQHPGAPDLPPEAAIIDARQSELSRATAILSAAEEWPDEDIRAACKSIIRLTRDWLLIERAAAMIRQLDREAATLGRGQA